MKQCRPIIKPRRRDGLVGAGEGLLWGGLAGLLLAGGAGFEGMIFGIRSQVAEQGLLSTLATAGPVVAGLALVGAAVGACGRR
ncbi:MAG: hypothetical protein WD534_17930 [Phycisphaeraceae bacterium]